MSDAEEERTGSAPEAGVVSYRTEMSDTEGELGVHLSLELLAREQR